MIWLPLGLVQRRIKFQLWLHCSIINCASLKRYRQINLASLSEIQTSATYGCDQWRAERSKLLLTQDKSVSNSIAGCSPEIVVAGTRFSTKPNTYLVDGIAVGEAAWQERLRGARELHQVVCEIYNLYPVGTSS